MADTNQYDVDITNTNQYDVDADMVEHLPLTRRLSEFSIDLIDNEQDDATTAQDYQTYLQNELLRDGYRGIDEDIDTLDITEDIRMKISMYDSYIYQLRSQMMIHIDTVDISEMHYKLSSMLNTIKLLYNRDYTHMNALKSKRLSELEMELEEIRHMLHTEQCNNRDLIVQLDSLHSVLNGLQYKMSLSEIQKYKIIRSITAEDCPICLDKIEVNDRIPSLQCKHILHFECFVVMAVHQSTCPLCRSNINS